MHFQVYIYKEKLLPLRGAQGLRKPAKGQPPRQVSLPDRSASQTGASQTGQPPRQVSLSRI